MFSRNTSVRCGFSLLELMVTLTILAVLAGAVAQVAFNGDGNKQAVAWTARSTIEQVRELALRHNCNASINFSGQSVSIQLFRDDDSPVESRQLQTMIGGSSKSISSVNSTLSKLMQTSQTLDASVVDSKGKNVNEVRFNFQGGVTSSSDLTVQINSGSFQQPIKLHVSRLTSLMKFE